MSLDKLLQIVNERQGIKQVDLSVAMADHGESWHLGDIAELIDRGLILEIEYTLPNMPYRLKSFLLPGNATVVSITKGGQKLDLEELAGVLSKMAKIEELKESRRKDNVG